MSLWKCIFIPLSHLLTLLFKITTRNSLCMDTRTVALSKYFRAKWNIVSNRKYRQNVAQNENASQCWSCSWLHFHYSRGKMHRCQQSFHLTMGNIRDQTNVKILTGDSELLLNIPLCAKQFERLRFSTVPLRIWDFAFSKTVFMLVPLHLIATMLHLSRKAIQLKIVCIFGLPCNKIQNSSWISRSS